ncbi:MAG: hypothetical protein KF777_23915 [Planctomycetaceae bacterium]|nr:hypothetical protein [Planctomycetaceae bacterium]
MDSERSFRPAPMFVLSTEGELLGVDTPANRDLVRRIEACVAACEGISTEELEAGIITQMRELLAQMVPVLQARQTQLTDQRSVA